MPARHTAWKRLARDLDPAHLDTITQVEPMVRMPELAELAEAILAGQVRGRVVMDVARSTAGQTGCLQVCRCAGVQLDGFSPPQNLFALAGLQSFFRVRCVLLSKKELLAQAVPGLEALFNQNTLNL